MTLEVQALTMLHMVGAGVYLGMAYETFTTLRIKKKNVWVNLVQDLLFWLWNVGFIFLWLQTINHGEMRLYIFLSLFCGYAMYKALLEGIYNRLLRGVIRTIVLMYGWIVTFFHYIIIKPIFWLYQMVWAILLFLMSIIVQLSRYFYSFILFCLRPLERIFSNGWTKYKQRRKQKAIEKEKNKQKKPKQKEGFFTWVAKRLFKK